MRKIKEKELTRQRIENEFNFFKFKFDERNKKLKESATREKKLSKSEYI